MKNFFTSNKQRLVSLVDRYNWYALYALRNKGYLFEMGWFESHQQKAAIGRGGRPIPWITYPSLTFLEERVKKDFVVFEYGSGNSTLWWAQRSNSVISCEHDPAWYAQVLPRIPQNVELNHVALEYGGAYSSLIRQYTNKFDVVFIDGRDRVNCVRNSLDALKPNGVIILDNSDVEAYAPALEFMSAQGFKRIDFVGPGPITPAVWRTSIFYRDGNCLNI
jgi:precorrin-6B methylase 2